MAKTANSKVIFLPATNQTVQSQLAQAENSGEGPSRYLQGQGADQDSTGFQSAINANVVEHI